MKKLTFVLFCCLSACRSIPPQPVVEPPVPIEPPYPAVPMRIEMNELKTQLGLEREAQQLGFLEKNYDGCRMALPGDEKMCGQRFFSTVHFRLLCRDTVGTTERVPSSLTPLRGRMQWRLNGKRGQIRTDKDGYGQMQMVSKSPSKEKQFILVIGQKFLGVEAGEVSQIVVPRNWCPGRGT